MEIKVKGRSDELLEAHLRMMESLKNGDTSAIATLNMDDVVMLPPNDTSIYGVAEVAEWFKEYFEHFKIVVLAESERDVMTLTDCAIERWNYQVEIQPLAMGDAIRDQGRFLIVWKRDAERNWKIAQMIWNSMRPIGSGTSRFMALLKERSKL